MMIALPNPDGSFTCTLFWEFEGPRSFATTKTDDEVRRFFDEEFPDAVPLMPALLDDFNQNPTGSLVTIRCGPWFYRGQGRARRRRRPRSRAVLRPGNERRVRRLRRARRMPGKISREPRARVQGILFPRRENTDALADLAIGNFIEMRDKTASKTFRAKKKLDHFLEAALPGIYLPLYTMVTFTRIPYATAARRARLQDRIGLRRIYRSNIARCFIDVLFRRALVGNHSNLSLVFVHHGFQYGDPGRATLGRQSSPHSR
jgi:kynurenine 3-monooxygenase